MGTTDAVRIGRTRNVWKLTDPRWKDALFLKFCKSTAHFDRQVLGISILNDLAAQHDWFARTEIIHEDRDRFAVITLGCKGDSFGKLFASSFRRDVNPLKKRSQRQSVAHCMQRIKDYIRALHQIPSNGVAHSDCLRDHRIPTIQSRLRKRLADIGIERPRILEQVDVEELENNVLVHGDLSPSNVFYDRGKIAVIDYENLGIGPRHRDLAWLDFALEEFAHRLWFQGSLIKRLLRNHTRQGDPPTSFEWTLSRTEFVANRLFALGLPNACPTAWHKFWGTLELRRTRRELISLLDRLDVFQST